MVPKQKDVCPLYSALAGVEALAGMFDRSGGFSRNV